jgi:hypothetical protein
MKDSADDQRWRQVLTLLAPVSSLSAVKGAEARWASAAANRRRQDSVRNFTRVEILERLSPTSIVVALADATSGRYGDQTWTLRIARSKGICSLSGEPFRPGDPVYRANVRRRNMTIARQAISAAAIARLEAELSSPHLQASW